MSGEESAATAADLARLSLGAVKAKDREAWLELFEDDAVVQDPVGPSALDPTGAGRQGKEQIARFYDDVISTMTSFDFEIERCYLGGDEAALAVTFTIGMGQGEPMVMDLINIYRRSSAGRLVSLRSFWDGTRQG